MECRLNNNSYVPEIALPTIIDTSVKASGIVGIIIGQICFGILGDRFGRASMYSAVLIIMIVGTFGSSFSASTISGFNIFGVLSVWRLILGVGIGGDFPLSGKQPFDNSGIYSINVPK